jgi:hypothetical protein
MKRLTVAICALVVALFAAPEASAQVEGEWLPTGTMTTGRQAQVQLRLSTGAVIAIGGYDATGNILASAEIYNPATRAWAPTGGMATARESFAGAVLANGKIIVAGGAGMGGVLLGSAELYDPAAGTWSSAGGLSVARYGLTATLLKNGKVLFAGGCDSAGCATQSGAGDIYDPATNSWSASGSLNVPRAFHSIVALRTGQVLAIGGYAASGASASTELFNPAANAWAVGPATLGIHYQGTATLLPDGKVLAAGGVQTKYPLNGAELYDPAANAWAATGGMASGRYAHTAALLPDGTVVVAGGVGQAISCGKACTGYIPFAAAEIYSEAKGAFTATAPLNRALAYHATTLTKVGQALTAGGEGLTATCCTTVPDAEIYTPLTLSFSAYRLNFGLLQIGLASSPQTVTLTNVSAHSTSFASIAASGDYSQTNSCPKILLPAQSCTIGVTFRPARQGIRAGLVVVRDSDPGSPSQTIALGGTGETLALGFTPGTVAFGTVTVGSTATQTAILTNDGASPVTLTGFTGVPKNGFAQSNACPAVLAVQQSCSVTLSFSPPDVFAYSAAVAVANGAGAPATVKLTGTGADGGG